jgi:lysophospholipase L1-like esterase
VRGKLGRSGEQRALRWAGVAVAVAVAVVVAAVLVAVVLARPDDGTPAARQEPPTPSAGTGPVDHIDVPPDPVLLVFGDSYVEGAGATSPETSFPHTLATDLGWRLETAGLSGTGYLNPSAAGNLTYLQRVEALQVAEIPDVVLIEGGINDRDQTGDETAAAVDVVRAVQARFPGTQVVLLSAVDPQPVEPRVTEIDRDLARAARLARVPLIDAGGWVTAANAGELISADHLHPSQAGHDRIGALAAAELRRLAA